MWLGDPREIRAVAGALKNLAALDPVHAEILERRLFEGRSALEIGALLGIPPRTVETLWLAIRAWTLREVFGGDLETEKAHDPFAQAGRSGRKDPC